MLELGRANGKIPGKEEHHEHDPSRQFNYMMAEAGPNAVQWFKADIPQDKDGIPTGYKTIYFAKSNDKGIWFVICDSGGSRDIIQRKSRFLPGSLQKLKDAIIISTADSELKAEYIGVVLYAVRAPEWYDRIRNTDKPTVFCWLSFALYIPEMAEDLCIMSMPQQQFRGMCQHAVGAGAGKLAGPGFFYPREQSKDGKELPTFDDAELTYVERSKEPYNMGDTRIIQPIVRDSSNMTNLPIISFDALDSQKYHLVNFFGGGLYSVEQEMIRLSKSMPLDNAVMHMSNDDRVCLLQSTLEAHPDYLRSSPAEFSSISLPTGHSIEVAVEPSAELHTPAPHNQSATQEHVRRLEPPLSHHTGTQLKVPRFRHSGETRHHLLPPNALRTRPPKHRHQVAIPPHRSLGCSR